MLRSLYIQNYALIEKLDIGFETGFSVITGETGAGKSILLDSLSLALGGRGDGSLVRHGTERGQVTAVFDVPGNHRARVLLRDNGIDDDGDLIFRRQQSADGRTKAYVNDQPVSVQLMRQAGQLLVEIHGQHDDRALVDTERERCESEIEKSNDKIAALEKDLRVRRDQFENLEKSKLQFIFTTVYFSKAGFSVFTKYRK